jgi:hypothetical protein
VRSWLPYAGRYMRDARTGDLGYITDAGAVTPAWWLFFNPRTGNFEVCL